MATISADFSDRAEYVVPKHIAEKVVLPAGYRDPKAMYEAFAWLRTNQPLGIATIDGFDPIWLVVKHADILAVERQNKLFRSMDANPILNTQADDEFLKSVCGGTTRVLDTLTHMDTPEHATYRQIASNYFLPGRIAKLEQQIREIARESVRQLIAKPGEVNFVKDFALHYPLRVIMTMLGVPREDEPKMLRLTQDFFGNQDPEERRIDVEISPEAGARQFRQTIEDFYAYFRTFTIARREAPQDDLMTLIANSKINGELISDMHANGYYIAIATAGHDTTSSTAATMMQMLAGDPALLAQVKADLTLIPNLIDETLRWATPVFHFMRSAAEDTELRGRPIRKGDRLMLCFPSANRDEEVFERPLEFDILRKPNKHMAFGNGPHMCIGQHLAKLELRILFEELLPNVVSARATGDPRYVEANFVGGLKSLPLELTFD